MQGIVRARAGCRRGQPCAHGRASIGGMGGCGLPFAPPWAGVRAGSPRSAGPGLGPVSVWPRGRPGTSQRGGCREGGGRLFPGWSLTGGICPPLQVTEGDIGPFSAVKVPVIFSPVTPGAIQTRFKVTFDNQECPTVSVPQTLDTHGHCRVDPSWTQGPGLPAPPHRTRGSCPRHPRSRC